MTKIPAVEKSQLANLNYKRYYFSDGVVSFLFQHPFLLKFREFKTKIEQRLILAKNIKCSKLKHIQYLKMRG